MTRNWSSGPSFYRKGSFHNKIGMLSLWIFLLLASIQILVLIFN